MMFRRPTKRTGTFALMLGLGALLACERNSEQEERAESTAVTRTHSSNPVIQAVDKPKLTLEGNTLVCSSGVTTPPPETPELITLKPVHDDKRMVLKKTGIIVSFSREDFLLTARCLHLDLALDHIEKQSGFLAETPLIDAFQLSYVAAALLDVGRAEVRLDGEKELMDSIARGAWSAPGCAGACRSFGRIYRLTPAEPTFFLRISDRAEYQSQ